MMRGTTLLLGSRTAFAATAAVSAIGVAGAVAARRALVLITVSGGSMSPTYTDGEKLLVRRGRPRVGDVVVFRHPWLAQTPRTATNNRTETAAANSAAGRPDVEWMVKRVVAVPADPVPRDFRQAVAALDPETTVPSGCLLVRGDNPRSLDSRHFGYVSTADVLGVAVRRRPFAR